MKKAPGFIPFFLLHRMPCFSTYPMKMAKGKTPRLLKGPLYTLLVSSTLFLAVALLLLFLIQEHLPLTHPARKVERFVRLERREEQWTEVLSWEPRAFLFHNFLSREECEYLISLAKPRIKKSTVVDDATGGNRDSGVRTSSGMFLSRGQDRFVRNIEKRIAEFTHIPVEHGEGLQILQYGHGQKYEPHHDYFNDPFNTKNGGQRMATMLMYLTDVEEGGETVFPAANRNFSSVPWWDELSDCGKRGLAVKPKMGNAVLFWSMKPDGTLDPRSLHGWYPKPIYILISSSKFSQAALRHHSLP